MNILPVLTNVTNGLYEDTICVADSRSLAAMYESHFGLSEKPFRLTPDAAFYYPSSEHERAMAFLQYGLELADGFIVITGDVGAGKTTLVQTLLQDLHEPGLVVANIVSSQLEDSEILQLAAIKMGYKVKNNPNKGALLDGLQNAFTQLGKRGGRALLIVDEAQHLSGSSLEELRMLSNFQLNGRALVQIFLVGQPEFRDTMVSQEFEQLKQRVIANHHLSPMNAEETRAYIEHRLRIAGWSGRPGLAKDAFTAVFDATRGLPRKINNLFDRVLLSAYLDQRDTITGKDVSVIAAEIEAEFSGPSQTSAERANSEPRETSKPAKSSSKLRAISHAQPAPPATETVIDEEWLQALQQEFFALDARLQMTATQLQDSKGLVQDSLARIDEARFLMTQRNNQQS